MSYSNGSSIKIAFEALINKVIIKNQYRCTVSKGTRMTECLLQFNFFWLKFTYKINAFNENAFNDIAVRLIVQVRIAFCNPTFFGQKLYMKQRC